MEPLPKYADPSEYDENLVVGGRTLLISATSVWVIVFVAALWTDQVSKSWPGTAAQVIPTLLLALSFESRILMSAWLPIQESPFVGGYRGPGAMLLVAPYGAALMSLSAVAGEGLCVLKSSQDQSLGTLPGAIVGAVIVSLTYLILIIGFMGGMGSKPGSTV